eukprot:584862-Rhodomonas_salina.2
MATAAIFVAPLGGQQTILPCFKAKTILSSASAVCTTIIPLHKRSTKQATITVGALSNPSFHVPDLQSVANRGESAALPLPCSLPVML